MLASDEFGYTAISNHFGVIQHAQFGKCMQKFVFFEQVQGVARAAFELALLSGIGLVHQEAAGAKRLENFREDAALKVEEDQNQVIALTAGGEFTEIRGLELDAIRKCSGVLLSLFKSHFRNIDQRHSPVLLREPHRVPSHSSGEVKRRYPVWKQHLNVMLEGA